MNLSAVTTNRQFKTVVLSMGGFSAIYFLINLLVIGGDAFIINLNSYLTIPLNLLVIYLSIQLWQQVKTAPKSHFLWSCMIAGWVLWTLAQILWIVFAALGQEVPYPSWADFFWLIGYIPMGIGLLARARSLRARLSSGQKTAFGGILAGTVILSLFFVILPIAQNNNPQAWLESALNIIYPIADLGLLMIVLYLFFAYEQGAYGFGWRLLLIGFILSQISDLIFSYASISDLYYPNAQVNWISSLGVDIPYNLSGIFWILGIYLLQILHGEHRPVELGAEPKAIPNTHLLIFTQKDGAILEVSQNFRHCFPTDGVEGKTLSEVLGLTRQEEAAITESLHTLKKLVDRPIQIRRPTGEGQEGWLCGMAILTVLGDYSGANFLLRIFTPDGLKNDKLSEAERSVLHYLSNQNICAENNQVRQLLLDYYLAQIKLLYNLAFQEGGPALTQALLDELLAVAQRRGWPLKFHPQTIVAGTEYPVELLRTALPALLEAAKQFVAEIAETNLGENQLQQFNSQIGKAVHQNIVQYGKNELALEKSANS